MRTSDTATALETAAREVLETMFFTSPLDDAPAEAADGPRICATVAFHGGRTGRFTVCVAEPAARELAEIFLCGDGEPGLGAVCEVAGELANMVCGSWLGRLEPEGLFELSRVFAGRCTGLHSGAANRALLLGGGSLRIYVEV